MSFFPPRHTAESVAAQLIEGFENGTITLDDTRSETKPESLPSSSPRNRATPILALLLAAVLQSTALAVALVVGNDEWKLLAIPVGVVAFVIAAGIGYWAGRFESVSANDARANITNTPSAPPTT